VDERLERIAHGVAEVLGERPVGGVHRLSSGASRETFAFELASRGPLVLQVGQGGTKLSQAPAEARLLSAAAEAGVPVPAVIAHGAEDPTLGASWWVVESLPGTTGSRSLTRCSSLCSARSPPTGQHRAAGGSCTATFGWGT